MSGTPDDEIYMGGLKAQLVKHDESSDYPRCCVKPGESGGPRARLHTHLAQNPRTALISPRPCTEARNAPKPPPNLKKLPKLDDAAGPTMGPNLTNILKIMWKPEEMEFRPVGDRWDETAAGWLTVEIDESSPRVRRLNPGERFNVLDLREKQSDSGSVIRVRTRNGWFTWGKMTEINERTRTGEGLHRHFRKETRMQRSDSSFEDPLDYAQDMAVSQDDNAPKLSDPEAVTGHEDAVWIDMNRVFHEKLWQNFPSEFSPEDIEMQQAAIKTWSIYPQSQQTRWGTMSGSDEWRNLNQSEAEQAKGVIKAAQRDLTSVPFFKNVPDAYLERLAETTAQNLQRFTKDEKIVRFIGGQSFPQKSLAANACRPTHQLSLTLEIAIPESISAADVKTWALLTNVTQRYRMHGVAGTNEVEHQLKGLGGKKKVQLVDKLKLVNELKRMDFLSQAGAQADAEPEPEPGPDAGPELELEPDADAEAKAKAELELEPDADAEAKAKAEAKADSFLLGKHEKVAEVGKLVENFLNLLQAHVKGMANTSGECIAYMVDPFREKGPDGTQTLLATVLLNVHTPEMLTATRDNILGAVRRLFGVADGTWNMSKPAVQLWWSWLVAEAPGDIDLEDTWDEFESALGKLVGGTRNISSTTLNALTVAEFNGALGKAGLTPDQLEDARGKIPGLQESLAAATAAAADEPNLFDQWLEKLGLLDKKGAFEEYEIGRENDPFEDLATCEDLDDLIEDDDLALDEEGQARLRAAIEKLPDLGLGLEPEPEPEPETPTEGVSKSTALNAYDAMTSHLCITSCQVSKTPSYAHGMLSHKLYVVQCGSIDVYSTNKTTRESRLIYTVDAGGHFGEMQLLHRNDLHGFAAARMESLVWTVDESKFHEFRGVTMELLRTVARRLHYCQQSSLDASATALIEGVPCFLDRQGLISKFKPLVNPNAANKLSEVPINLYSAWNPFGLEELRVFLDGGVRFRALVIRTGTLGGTDGAEMIAEYMQAKKFDDLSLLSIENHSDHGLCKLIRTLLERRILKSDGNPAMRLLKVNCGVVNDLWSDARLELLQRLNHDRPVCAEKVLDLRELMDYPIDLACCFAKFATRLAEELPNARYDEYIPQFEQLASSMLEQSNAASEVEIILRQAVVQRPDHVSCILPDCRDLFEYAISDPPLVELAACPAFSDYADAFWTRHQVTAVHGLDEDELTSLWRDQAEEVARTLFACRTWTEMVTAPIKWGIWMVLLPVSFVYLQLGRLALDVQTRNSGETPNSGETISRDNLSPDNLQNMDALSRMYAVIYADSEADSDSGETSRDCCCTKALTQTLRCVFVALDAMWTIPIISAYSWFSLHVFALGNTSLIAAYLDVREDGMSWLEVAMYAQAAGMIMGECAQIGWAFQHTKFTDGDERPLEDTHYGGKSWVKRMIGGPEHRGAGCALMWLFLPLWWPVVRLLTALVTPESGFAVTAAMSATVVAIVPAVWCLADSSQWFLTSAAVAISIGLIFGLMKSVCYSYSLDGTHQFRANLTLRVPADETDDLGNELNDFYTRKELIEQLVEELVDGELVKTRVQLQGQLRNLLVDIEDHLARQEDARKLWKKKAEVGYSIADTAAKCLLGKSSRKEQAAFTTPFDARVTCPVRCSTKFDFRPCADREDYLVDVGIIVSIYPQTTDAVETINSMEDMLTRTASWLLKAAGPHHMPHWSPTDKHEGLRVKQIEVIRPIRREAVLVSVALDDILAHGQRVWLTHAEDFWQSVDATVCIAWIVNAVCRYMLKYEATEHTDGSSAWMLHLWTSSIAWIVLGMWIRTMHFMMLSATLGPLVMSMIKIFKTDVINFFKLFGVLLCAFSTAFMIAYRQNTRLFTSIGETIFFSFKAAFGSGSIDDMEGASEVTLGEVMFWAYFLFVRFFALFDFVYNGLLMLLLCVVQVNVVLLNLLIAMMGETYSSIITQRGLQEWRLQKTRFVHEYSACISDVGRIPPMIILTAAFGLVSSVSSWFASCPAKCCSANAKADLPLWAHFLEDPDNPVRSVGSELTKGHSRRASVGGSADRPGAWNRFADFHDRAEAGTPQLALHQRWRDYAEQFEDELRKEKIVMQAQTRRVDDLDTTIRGRELLDIPAALKGDHASVSRWKSSHVRNWLQELAKDYTFAKANVNLNEVAEEAKLHDIGGAALLKLTNEAWKDLGVNNNLVVSQLMAKVHSLARDDVDRGIDSWARFEKQELGRKIGEWLGRLRFDGRDSAIEAFGSKDVPSKSLETIEEDDFAKLLDDLSNPEGFAAARLMLLRADKWLAPLRLAQHADDEDGGSPQKVCQRDDVHALAEELASQYHTRKDVPMVDEVIRSVSVAETDGKLFGRMVKQIFEDASDSDEQCRNRILEAWRVLHASSDLYADAVSSMKSALSLHQGSSLIAWQSPLNRSSWYDEWLTQNDLLEKKDTFDKRISKQSDIGTKDDRFDDLNALQMHDLDNLVKDGELHLDESAQDKLRAAIVAIQELKPVDHRWSAKEEEDVNRLLQEL
eukprot:COSAG06_NODE_27_length_32053_cov_79.812950_20_plen_2508_part_00